jgi:hypothetical protein
MKREQEEFDERQLQIRKNIFKHGFLVAIGALLLNAFLNDRGIVWASGFHQNIFILVLIITTVSVEFHIRNVYFGRGIPRVPILGILGICVVVLAILSGIHFVEGAAFITNGSLTDEGTSVILCAMFSVDISCGIIQSLRNNRTEKINPNENN